MLFLIQVLILLILGSIGPLFFHNTYSTLMVISLWLIFILVHLSLCTNTSWSHSSVCGGNGFMSICISAFFVSTLFVLLASSVIRVFQRLSNCKLWGFKVNHFSVCCGNLILFHIVDCILWYLTLYVILWAVCKIGRLAIIEIWLTDFQWIWSTWFLKRL